LEENTRGNIYKEYKDLVSYVKILHNLPNQMSEEQFESICEGADIILKIGICHLSKPFRKLFL